MYTWRRKSRRDEREIKISTLCGGAPRHAASCYNYLYHYPESSGCDARGRFPQCWPAAVSSIQRASKNERMLWPALPTGESSSLNVSQLSKITLTSAQNSSRPLYLREQTSRRRCQLGFARRDRQKKQQAFIWSEISLPGRKFRSKQRLLKLWLKMQLS